VRPQAEKFHIHDIRHIDLSLIAETGQDRKVIQQRARHASATSTDRYIHTTKRQHEKAVEDVDASSRIYGAEPSDMTRARCCPRVG